MQKALKGNLVFLWIIIIFVIGVALTGGIDSGINTLKCMAPLGLMATIIYFIPFNEKAKGTILASIPAVFALILSVIQSGEVKMFYIYILSLIMQSLYFNRKLIIGYGSVMSLALMIMGFVSPALLVGSNSQMIEIIIPIGAFILVFILLVLLTTIEKEKALVAAEQADSSQEVLEKLEIVLKKVSLATNSLKDKFNSCNDKIKTGKKGTQSITTSMEDIVISAGAATTTVSNISRSTTVSREHFGEIYEAAAYINQYFKDTIEDINDSQASVVSLRQGMDKMRQVASRNYEIVQQFAKQAEDIGGFADEIANISNQTNLLALDASIEAVRVGKQGEKFAEVAEKIRILSEENGKHVNRIRDIINELAQPIDVTTNEDDEINLLNEKLENIKGSVNLAEGKIQGKLKIANTIKNEFSIIDNDIHNITVVIEENAVRFEEVLVRMEHQAEIINEASSVMAEMVTISENLDKLWSSQRAN